VSDKITTAAINNALRVKYAAPRWALLFNVADATGMVQGRWADAIAMSVWPSQGLELHGMEVKASRGDWLRERAKPEKAEAIATYCDHWWLIAAKDVAKDDEIPPAWGWIEWNGDRLVTRRQSTKTDAAPMTRGFLASLLRRAAKADEDLVGAAIEAEKKQREERFADRVAREVEHRTRHEKAASEAIERFKQASGVKIEEYRGEDIGLAVKAVLKSGVTATYGSLHSVADEAEKAVAAIREALSAGGYEARPRVDLSVFTRKSAR